MLLKENRHTKKKMWNYLTNGTSGLALFATIFLSATELVATPKKSPSIEVRMEKHYFERPCLTYGKLSGINKRPKTRITFSFKKPMKTNTHVNPYGKGK